MVVGAAPPVLTGRSTNLNTMTELITGWLAVFRIALIFFTFSLGTFVIDGPMRLAFFELAAEVLLILLLAFAVEVRLLTPSRDIRGPDLGAAIALFVVLAFGEAVSLHAVATGSATSDEGTIVGASIAAGIVGIGLAALSAAAAPPPLPRWARRRRRCGTPDDEPIA